MSRFADPLVVGRVIGEVVDLFVPSICMTVAYGPKDISNGVLLRPSATAAPPLVRISGRRNDLYTLVLIEWNPLPYIYGPPILSCPVSSHMHACFKLNNINLLPASVIYTA
jgi:hypothetical protein